MQKYEEAVVEAEFAIEHKSKFDAESYMIIGFSKRWLFKYHEAIDALETSNKIVFAQHGIKDNEFVGRNLLALGQLYLYVGEIEQAQRAYLEASRCNINAKDKSEAYSSYLLCLHYDDKFSDEFIFEQHCKYPNIVPIAEDKALYKLRKKRNCELDIYRLIFVVM